MARLISTWHGECQKTSIQYVVFNYSYIQIISHSPQAPLGPFLSLADLPETDLDPDDENGHSEVGKRSLGYQCFF